MRIRGRNFASVRTKTPCEPWIVGISEDTLCKGREKVTTEHGSMHAYPMIRLQIVHLLPPHHGPNILAQKLNHIKLMVVDIPHRIGARHAQPVARVVLEPRPVAAEALREALADPEAQPVQAHEDGVAENGRDGEVILREEERWWVAGGRGGEGEGLVWRGCGCGVGGVGVGFGAGGDGDGWAACAGRGRCGGGRGRRCGRRASRCAFRGRGALGGERPVERGLVRARHALGQRDELDQEQVEDGDVDETRVHVKGLDCAWRGSCHRRTAPVTRPCGLESREQGLSVVTGAAAVVVDVLEVLEPRWWFVPSLASAAGRGLSLCSLLDCGLS
jgi:hypothetical protein